MVTIEQKLTLFSKLLSQDIKEESSEKFEALEKEYDKRIAESKAEVDKEAAEIIDQAKRRAELKKVELISRGKLASKKEQMSIKEELINRFMEELEKNVRDFVTKEAYKTYLKKIIKGLTGLAEYKNDLVIYLTKHDYEVNQEFIKEELGKLNIMPEQLSFEVMPQDILGGMIIKDPALSMRVDESIRTLIDEEKDIIVEKISKVIEDAGDDENE